MGGLRVGSAVSGTTDSFKKFSTSRFATKHLFVVEGTVDGSDLPSLYVLRGVFPFNEIQTFPLERDNSNVYYPELVDVADVELEMYETADNQVFDFFETWFDKIFAVNERNDKVFSLPDLFKKNIYVFRLDSVVNEGATEYNRVFGYEYSGCFPKRLTDYPLDMGEADAVVLGITFSVDSVRRLRIGEGVSEVVSVGTGITNPDPVSSVTTVQQEKQASSSGLQGSSLVKRTEERVSNKISGLKQAITSKSLGIWARALIKAAAATGINIAEREAYRMAYAAGKKYGHIAGGVDNTRDVFEGII